MATCLFAEAANARAQDPPHIDQPEIKVVLTELSPPIYPPLARQARITGDVKLQIGIRQDGTIGSAEVISGHPMLKQAALDSANKSKFGCRGCPAAVTTYLLTYTFDFLDHDDDNQCGSSTQLRSAKCLYLWRCGKWQSTFGLRLSGFCILPLSRSPIAKARSRSP
jgi:TonB family protein